MRRLISSTEISSEEWPSATCPISFYLFQVFILTLISDNTTAAVASAAVSVTSGVLLDMNN
ncbi:hypothetical protein MTR_6g472330 [Medicago truncatula]|uniref:Uncharacterized protein n=1 Tax=Medicago truncatula TaxID=3880 RepID=A0A072UAP9_MEDTR|nr:hypothetical protein MTR_6g472330 [Medicago truncatula]